MRGRLSVVGFFSAGCSACKDQVPLFAEHAVAQRAAVNGDAQFVLAVIVGPADETADYQAALEGKVMVIREDRRGPVTTNALTPQPLSP